MLTPSRSFLMRKLTPIFRVLYFFLHEHKKKYIIGVGTYHFFSKAGNSKFNVPTTIQRHGVNAKCGGMNKSSIKTSRYLNESL